MFDIIGHQGKANQNHGKMPLKTLDWLKFKRYIIPNFGKAAEELELSYSTSGNVK